MTSYFEKFIHHRNAIIILWCIVIPVVFLKHNFLSTVHNNYKVYKYAYIHALEGRSLYGHYPEEYGDKNNYGPVYSLLFAPFALLPDMAGHFFWVATLVLLLMCAIRSLPLTGWQKNVVMLISLNELLTSAFNVQFNIAVAALIVLTFVLIHREKEFWAPLPMLIGTFVKLYGIVGLAFFFLVKDKTKFIVGCIVWSVVLFVLPMILSSPEYVVNSYQEWYKYLIIKNSESISLTTFQDISIMGFFRRVFADPSIPSMSFLAVGVLLFGLPYLRFSQYKNPAYQLLLLASTLMFPVIFSPASESSTYIIVFVGIAIWFAIQPRPYHWQVWALLAFAILLGSLNTTDIYPKAFRSFLRIYSVKALPCFVIWLRVIYEMMRKDFSDYQVPTTLQSPS